VEVLIVTVFVSLVLVAAAVVLFIMCIRGGDLEHGDRLSLLPLEEDGARDQGSARDTAAGAGPGQAEEGDRG
jgi:hypothetical protein